MVGGEEGTWLVGRGRCGRQGRSESRVGCLGFIQPGPGLHFGERALGRLGFPLCLDWGVQAMPGPPAHSLAHSAIPLQHHLCPCLVSKQGVI